MIDSRANIGGKHHNNNIILEFKLNKFILHTHIKPSL